MKQVSSNRIKTIVRTGTAVALLSFFSMFLYSFTVSRRLGDELWQQLGITRQQGTDQIKNSFLNNYFDYYSARSAKNIASGNRAAVARDLITYARQYLGSAEFATLYEKERQQAKPAAPTGTAKSKEAIRAEKIAETKDLIKQTEDIIKTADPSMRKAMDEILAMHKNNLKEYQDPNSQMIDMFYQGEVFQHENDMTRYKESLQQWEEYYPEDARALIRKRLQRYLDIAQTVDFGAELVEKNGRKKFVRSEYEAKNAEWKMVFRAGYEVYTAAKPLVGDWLRASQ